MPLFGQVLTLAERKLVSHSKFYFFDAGVYRILRPQGILDSSQEIEGLALEGLVAQHLRSWVLAQTQPHSLSFWRTQTKLEVDFIVMARKDFGQLRSNAALTLAQMRLVP